MSDLNESQKPSADLQSPWTPEVRGVLMDWRDRADVASKTHFAVANRLSALNLGLGIPVVVLTTLVGTSVFATLQQALSTTARILAGIAIGALLSSQACRHSSVLLSGPRRTGQPERRGPRSAERSLKCWPSIRRT